MVANINLSAVMKFSGLHNHEEETEEIQKENIRPKMIQKVQNDPTKLLNDNVLERNPSESCPEYHSVKSSLYRERRKELPQPPQTLTLDIRGRWKKTLTGARLLKNNRSSGVVVYATRRMLEKLSQTSIIIADGTFKACPEPFEQTCVFFGAFD